MAVILGFSTANVLFAHPKNAIRGAEFLKYVDGTKTAFVNSG
jgi:hypothetical protein